MSESAIEAILSILVFMATALLTMLFWNLLMPAMFGLTTITYLQACGLKFLCGCMGFSVSHK